MLVLSRKKGQRLIVGADIVVRVVSIDGNRVKLGIEAPQGVLVLRDELMPHDESEVDHGLHH